MALPLRIVSGITFHFWEQVFSAGKASKEAYSGYYITFLTTQSSAEKMPPKWNVIPDTILNQLSMEIFPAPANVITR